MQIPEYLVSLEKAFVAHSDTETARQRERYMKDKFVFFGVKSPMRRMLYRDKNNNSG
jgi:hypothetical protein